MKKCQQEMELKSELRAEAFYPKGSISQHLHDLLDCITEGHLGGSVVEHLPLVQVLILGSWDRIPYQAPCREPASPSASVSASLSVSHE